MLLVNLNWREKAKQLKKELKVIKCAIKSKKVPWYAYAVAGITVAYAISPIDLIPDFIPVIGHLDDLVLVPLGIYISLKLIPDFILKECRNRIYA